MKTSSRFLIALLLLIAIVLPISAYAQLDGEMLGSVFSILGSLKIFENYEKYPYVADYILALVLFIGVSSFFLKERIGTMGSTGIGIILATALGFGEYQSGFSLGVKLGPIALLIFILILGIGIFTKLQRMGMGATLAASIAYFIAFLLLSTTGVPVLNWMKQTQAGMLIMTVLSTIWVLLIIITLVSVFTGSSGATAGVLGSAAGAMGRGIGAGLSLGAKGAVGGAKKAWEMSKNLNKAVKLHRSESNLEKFEEELTDIERRLEESEIKNEEDELAQLEHIIAALRNKQLERVTSIIGKFPNDPRAISLKTKYTQYLSNVNNMIKNLLRVMQDSRKNFSNEKAVAEKESNVGRFETTIEKTEKAAEAKTGLTNEINALRREFDRLRGLEIKQLAEEKRSFEISKREVDEELSVCNRLSGSIDHLEKGILGESALKNIISDLERLRERITNRIKRQANIHKETINTQNIEEMLRQLTEAIEKKEEVAEVKEEEEAKKEEKAEKEVGEEGLPFTTA
jgi:hypothetical protein